MLLSFCGAVLSDPSLWVSIASAFLALLALIIGICSLRQAMVADKVSVRMSIYMDISKPASLMLAVAIELRDNGRTDVSSIEINRAVHDALALFGGKASITGKADLIVESRAQLNQDKNQPDNTDTSSKNVSKEPFQISDVENLDCPRRTIALLLCMFSELLIQLIGRFKKVGKTKNTSYLEELKKEADKLKTGLQAFFILSSERLGIKKKD